MTDWHPCDAHDTADLPDNERVVNVTLADGLVSYNYLRRSLTDWAWKMQGNPVVAWCELPKAWEGYHEHTES